MANYVQANLLKDEEVVFVAKVHWASLIIHVILMIIFIGFITIIPAIIRLVTTELGITNKKLAGKMGLINTKVVDSPLSKINNVSVESGLFGKIFGYGTIMVSTSSEVYNFKCIKSPEVFRSTLMQEVDKFAETQMKKQASEMAKAMRSEA